MQYDALHIMSIASVLSVVTYIFYIILLDGIEDVLLRRR